MLQMAHRILAEKSPESLLRWCGPGSNDENLIAAKTAYYCLRSCIPVILADNVVDYAEDRSASGQVELLISAFPPCPPPFTYFFVESRALKHLSQYTKQNGVLFYTNSLDGLDVDYILHWQKYRIGGLPPFVSICWISLQLTIKVRLVWLRRVGFFWIN